MWGAGGGKGNNFLKSHRRGSKNHRRNFVSYINQPTYPQEKPHLNSSRQIRIFPISKDLLRSFHFLTLVFNRLPFQARCSLAYVKSLIILPRLLFILIISSVEQGDSWMGLLWELCPSLPLGTLFHTYNFHTFKVGITWTFPGSSR